MRILFLSYLFFLHGELLLCQECPVSYTDSSFSQNRQYYVTLRWQWASDQRVGVDTVSLKHYDQRIIWTKAIKGVSANPVVSNKGDVAVTIGPTINFYNENGDPKGIFDSSILNSQTLSGFLESDFDSPESYSTNGKYYYTTTGLYSGPAYFLTLSDSGKELNRQPLNCLNAYNRRDFIAYKNKIIICDEGSSWRPDYLNWCCVYNEGGNLIWKYKEENWGRYPRWSMNFNPHKGLLTIIDDTIRKTVLIDTLK